MPAIIRNDYRFHQCDEFIESVSEGAPDDRFYLTIAKDDPWVNDQPGLYVEASPDDNNPPTPKDTFQSEYLLWDRIIAGKLLTSGDVHRVIKRVDWESGTVYPQYDHQVDDLYDQDFFVVHQDGANTNVYKCISNNGGAQSTVAPTGVSTSIITTGDGYRWKYMYTLTAAQFEKFVTTDWVPVQTLDADDGSEQWNVQQAAVDGAINFLDIINGGSGGTDGSQTVNLTGDGSGFAATATVSGGVVTSINITNPGSGYREVTSITVDTVTNPDIRAMIEPKGGHGSDAVRELGGFFSMVNAKLIDTEGGDFPVGDDFRIIGVLKNPLQNDGNPFTGTTFGALDIGGDPTEIEVDTGVFLYTEFREPVIRSSTQTEDIKLIVQF